MPKKINKDELAFPFNQAEYEVRCPFCRHYPVQLSTGYSVFVPQQWEQWGVCPKCKTCLQRKVGMTSGMKFVAGPLHLYGERPKKEANWLHDVLGQCSGVCPRCREKELEKFYDLILEGLGRGISKKKILDILVDKIRKDLKQIKAQSK